MSRCIRNPLRSSALARTARLGLRATPDQEAVLRRAAEVSHKSLTHFISTDHQGLGIGVGMLQDAIRRTLLIAGQAGIQAILTHPLYENAAGFTTRFGFIPSPLRPQQRLLLLKDARTIRH